MCDIDSNSSLELMRSYQIPKITFFILDTPTFSLLQDEAYFGTENCKNILTQLSHKLSFENLRQVI